VIDWADLYLGVIAAATLTMAVLQVAAVVAAGRMARRLERLADRVESDLKPFVGHLDAIGRDAAHAASLATAQVERVDRLFADLGQRAEHTLTTLQAAFGGTAREGAALMAGLRAALGVLRDRSRGATRSEEEDALFI
jgi:hypothetical protein